MVLLLVGFEYAGWITHYNLQGFADPTLYHKWSYYSSGSVALSTVLYGATYLTSTISGELKKRQRDSVRLGTERAGQKDSPKLPAKKRCRKTEHGLWGAQPIPATTQREPGTVDPG